MKKMWLVIGSALLTLAITAGAAMAGGELLLYNWSDYTAPDLIAKFEKDTGIKVTLDIFDSNETLLAKLKSGGGVYDIVVPTHNFVPIMIEEGLLEKIDAPKLKGYDNIIDSMKSPPWDPGNVYTIPWNFGSTSFCVNTDVYKGDIESYKVLFEPPQELHGKIGMFDSSEEDSNMAIIYLGLTMCSEDPAEMKKVQDLLLAQKPAVKVYSSEGIHERLVSGDVAISGCWNGSAMRARKEKPGIRYVYPKEGLLGWADNLVIPKAAKNKESARKFLEFMMQPENAAIQSNFSKYSNAIKGSEAFLDEELKNAPELRIPEGTKMFFQPTCSEKAIKLLDKVWTKVKQ
ncbi:MAG: extracellular solute-binding protein [Pseudomonadota bacterium]